MTQYQQLENVLMSIPTQGNTGSASTIKLIPTRNASTYSKQFAVRVSVCDEGLFSDATNATIAAVAGYGTVFASHQATKDLTFLTTLDVQAAQTLTLTGVVINGETATTGSRVYEFDTSGAVSGSNVQTDISASATASQGTLTIAEPLTIGDTFQVGTQTYVCVANGTGSDDGEIDIGADEAASKVNIVAAIMGTDGYNTANSDVSAATFAADICTLTALVAGTAGDALVTVEIGQGLTHASNVFDAATLGTETAGADCTAANAITALALAITNDSSAVATAVDGAGDTLVATAIAAGTVGNSLASTEAMANASWGAVTFAGATDEVLGEIRVALTNATAETVVVRLGPPDIAGLCLDYTDLKLDVTHAAP